MQLETGVKRFLDRNQYCIWFSHRCNYACSYCSNYAGQGNPYSLVETEPAQLIEVFNSVEPGVIMVSGGEPVLWEAMPRLLEELPQHYWVILTNLSILKRWLFHDRVKLVIAAYHHEFTPVDAFTEKLLALRGKVMVKILVVPGVEEEHLGLWKRWGDLGIPTHLVPISWPMGCQPEFLDRFRSGELLTSCMYNSRFFNEWVHVPRKCVAGTRDMFQVMPGGGFSACSQTGKIEAGGTIMKPVWNEKPRLCDQSCSCEWHHWAGMALAEDNQVWDNFAETGEWENPTMEQFRKFVENMKWTM